MKESARGTIVRSLRAQIAAQKVPVEGQRSLRKIDNESKAALLEAVKSIESQPLRELKDFSLAQEGIRSDVTNGLPHAMLGLGGAYLVRFKTLEAHSLDTSAAKRLFGR